MRAAKLGLVLLTCLAVLAPDPAAAGGNWLNFRRGEGKWVTWGGPWVPGAPIAVRAGLWTKGEPQMRERLAGDGRSRCRTWRRSSTSASR